MVLGVGSTMSMRRLWMRISKCSRESLSLWGERITVKRCFSVGKGTGPRTVAWVRTTVSGPVPLPTEKNVYCVIRSPFKDKDSREHFEIRTHKRLIDILQPSPKTVDSLQRLDSLPAGVDIEIKL